MTRRTTPRRPGYTLFEMIAVVGVIGVAVTMSMSLILGAFQVERTANTTHKRLTTRTALIDEFRADVSRATAAPASKGDLKAGPTCLILSLPGDVCVYYRWHEGVLERDQLPGLPKPHQRGAGFDVTAVTFDRSGSGDRLITMTLTEAVGTGNLRHQSEISAALGGDLR
jgi:type II secretory pathway pseudopilin PulG